MSELRSPRKTRTYRKEKASQRCGEGVSEENNEDILVCERACLANEEHGFEAIEWLSAVELYSAQRHYLRIVEWRSMKKDLYHDLEYHIITAKNFPDSSFPQSLLSIRIRSPVSARARLIRKASLHRVTYWSILTTEP